MSKEKNDEYYGVPNDEFLSYSKHGSNNAPKSAKELIEKSRRTDERKQKDGEKK